MSTTVVAGGPVAEPRADGQRTSWLRRAARKFMEAREAQGQRRVMEFLSTLTDERLSELGYGPAEIREIREFGGR